MEIKNLVLMVVVILSIVSFSHAKSSLVYSLTLNYDGNTLTEGGLRLIEGIAPNRIDQPEQGFTLMVKDFNGNILHSFKFAIDLTPTRSPPRELFDENGTQIIIPQDGGAEQKSTQIVLVVPYFENAKSIEIYDENNSLKLSVDVSKYSKTSSVNVDTILLGVAGLIVIVVLIILLLVKKKRKSFNKTKQKLRKRKKK